MANFPCPNKADCFCDPNPTTNFSSELPDLFEFLGIQWNFPPTFIGDPGPGPAGQPPGVCFSPTSQEVADLCAGTNSYPRGNPPGGRSNGFPTTPTPLFFNTEQSCSHTCPDGSVFVFRVPSGSFLSYNQDLSNEMAHSRACKRANDLHICFIPPTPNVCLGDDYLSSITVPLAVPPVTFTITSGSLPLGIEGSTSADGTTFLLEGTPIAAGNSTFTIMAVDTQGNTMIGTYTIRVLGITNIMSLPDAVENTAYSVQLNADGGTAPFTFELVSGTVPGIILSTSGLLSGTPDYITAGTYPIKVKVTNSELDSCTFDGTININLRPGPDWTKLIWSVYSTTNGGAGSSASGSGSANQASGAVQWAGNLPFASIGPVQTTGILYTGPAVTARIRVTVAFSQTGGGGNTMAAEVKRNGAQIGSYAQGFTNGTHEFDIAIPPSAGDAYSIDDIGGGNFWAICTGVGATASLSFSWAIFNV
jgi:hypothetical protein